jgi:hypothetical protein
VILAGQAGRGSTRKRATYRRVVLTLSARVAESSGRPRLGTDPCTSSGTPYAGSAGTWTAWQLPGSSGPTSPWTTPTVTGACTIVTGPGDEGVTTSF